MHSNISSCFSKFILRTTPIHTPPKISLSLKRCDCRLYGSLAINTQKSYWPGPGRLPGGGPGPTRWSLSASCSCWSSNEWTRSMCGPGRPVVSRDSTLRAALIWSRRLTTHTVTHTRVRNVECLEWVQNTRTTKLIGYLTSKPYEDRLQVKTLDKRRLRNPHRNP